MEQGQLFISALQFLGSVLIPSDNVYKLTLGIMVATCILFLIAIIVTCLVTWRHKKEKLRTLIIVRKHHGNGTTDMSGTHHQLGYASKKGLSQSTSDLRRKAPCQSLNRHGPAISASCSAIHMSLPSKPTVNDISKLYSHNKPKSILVDANIAYDEPHKLSSYTDRKDHHYEYIDASRK